MCAMRSPRLPGTTDIQLGRRRLLQLGAVGIGAMTLAACSSKTASSSGSTAALSGQIIWADFGGPTNEARQKIYFAPFTKATGVKVTSVTEEDAIMQQMVYDGEDGDYDAIHVGLDDAYSSKANLVKIPAKYQDDKLPAEIRAYAFGTFFVGHAQGYLTATFPDGGPTTWADFWDVETYPGKRGWPGAPGSYDSACEIALLASGVAPEDLYPLDFDAASKKLDELRDHMVFYTSYPEIQTLLSSGSAAVVMGPSGQFAALNASGTDVDVSWNQAVVSPNVLVIPTKAPDKANILALTKYFHEPKLQAKFAASTSYGPGNSKAYDYISASVQDTLVNSPKHTEIVDQNSKWRAGHKSELLKWYTTWLAG